MPTEKEEIKLSELVRYLDGITKERLDTLRKNGELGRTTFYTKSGKILSQKALDIYLKNIEFYINRKFDYVTTGGPRGNSSYENHLYNNDIISVPVGLIKWINDFVEIQQINNDLRKKTISENRTIFAFLAFFSTSVALGGSYGSFLDGSIELFDFIGRVFFYFIIVAVVTKLISFLIKRHEKKKYLNKNEHIIIDALLGKGRVSKDNLREKVKMKESLFNKSIQDLLARDFIENEINGDQLAFNPKIEALIEHKLWKELNKL